MAKKLPSNRGGGDPTTTATEKTLPRYSDAELLEFKQVIDNKLLSLKDELEASKQEDLSQLESWEKENVLQTRIRIGNQIKGLEAALVRIGNKSYGICSVTQQLIPKGRLLVQLTATKTVEAEQLGNQISLTNPDFDNFKAGATEDDALLIPHEE